MNNVKFSYEPLYDAQRPLQEKKRWDVFENPPVKKEIGSVVQKRWIEVGERCAKIFAYIITFTIVLGGAIISKGTLMFMIAQLSNVTRPYCNLDLDRNKQFQVTLPQTERLAWMWLVMFAFFVPQIGTFLRSARKLIYKTWKRPEPLIFRLVFVSETLMTIGIAIFVFAVLPRLDSVKALMLTNSVCFIPAVLSFVGSLVRKFRDDEYKADPNWFVTLAFDLLSVLAQASAFIIWPMIEDDKMLWLTVASGILISCGWWENFIPLPKESKNMIRFENGRYFIYVFVSLWKCVVFFASMVAIVWIKEGYPDRIFNDFIAAFQTHPINITEVRPIIEGVSSSIVEDVISVGLGTTIKSYSLAPVWVFVINIISTWLCYIVAKWACKINIQGFSYSFPINLTVPVALSILIAMCGFYMTNECSFYYTIPLYLFFNSPPMYDLNHFIAQQQSWIWLFWLLSQAWITVHTWMPKCEKLASTEKLFVRPMYEPFLIDQDLALNRRVDDGADWREEVQEEEYLLDTVDMSAERVADFTTPHPDDNITRIYACATMWHETKEEMMEFLKSIFRMDEDHNARRTVREQFHFNLPDYYEIETHIFFDDAFVRVSQDDPDPQINDWVKTLVDSIDEAASVVHEVNIRLRPPKKFITPYGGRLVWTLPGKTKMIAHLKDKKKIRAKKRWSQVMYMYYLLGHRLMERTDICSARKDVIGENTFILALDGDIDFQPKAVHLLVDLMKKNKTLGAACGRIHPLGSGPLVWYQMFEYAIGHWMQKATEHVIGCVLCSPGCFSLFRGKSLMDDSVMRKYTTKSSEARHYVQYDQGEDRWLCTLLLQRGYRVEYAAASDAFTHCPEGFNEFYNQRRRWMPSTMANILDLLMNAGPTIKINDNISRGYIAYQGLLMAGTILGPGTIFLMLIGSFVAVFQLSQWESLLWNAVPLGVFLVTCALFSKDKIQLFMAAVLSLVYSLVMMAVFIGIALQARSDGILAPSSLFFFCVIMQFVIAALLHPKEMVCLLYIGVYYVTVPSMYMLLVIYSVFNMNNVSWGTREVTVMQAAQNAANSPTPGAPKKKEKKGKNWIVSWCGGKPEETGGAIDFSIASLFRCVWCTNLDKSQNPQLTEINNALLSIQARLDKMEGSNENEEEVYSHPPRRSTRTMAGFGIVGTPSIDNQSLSDESSEVIENTWIDDPALQRGEVEFISSEEYEFWNGLLDKYLHPIDDTKDKARIAQELKNLRDKVVLAFFMLNAVFVLIIFLLTLNKDVLYIQWPLGYSVNFTYVEDINQIRIYKSYLELEPIGIIFLALFASLLIIQFFGMLFHRFQTFSQIVANTAVSFTCWKQSEKKLTEDEVLEQNPVDVAKKLQKLKGADDVQEDLPEDQVGRRKTIHLIDNRFRNPKETITDLDTAFNRRYGKIAANENYQGPIRRDTVMAIERRKSRLTRPSGLPRGQRNLGFVIDDSTI